LYQLTNTCNKRKAPEQNDETLFLGRGGGGGITTRLSAAPVVVSDGLDDENSQYTFSFS
jgi:hypothetical protein